MTRWQRWNRPIREVHPNVYLVGGVILLLGGIAGAVVLVVQGVALDWDWTTQIESTRRGRTRTASFGLQFTIGVISVVGLIGVGALVVVRWFRGRALPPVPYRDARHRR